MSFHGGQALVDQPFSELVVVGLEHRPALAVAVGATRPGQLAHLGHEGVV